jgi:hypothetical protein
MARPNVEKPTFWNESWYRKEKSKGKSDREIADELYVSICLFNKWKKELDIPKWKYTFSYAGNFKRGNVTNGR